MSILGFTLGGKGKLFDATPLEQELLNQSTAQKASMQEEQFLNVIDVYTKIGEALSVDDIDTEMPMSDRLPRTQLVSLLNAMVARGFLRQSGSRYALTDTGHRWWQSSLGPQGTESFRSVANPKGSRVTKAEGEDKNLVRTVLGVLPKYSKYLRYVVNGGQEQYQFDLTEPYLQWSQRQAVSHIEQQNYLAYFRPLLDKVKRAVASSGAQAVMRENYTLFVVREQEAKSVKGKINLNRALAAAQQEFAPDTSDPEEMAQYNTDKRGITNFANAYNRGDLAGAKRALGSLDTSVREFALGLISESEWEGLGYEPLHHPVKPQSQLVGGRRKTMSAVKLAQVIAHEIAQATKSSGVTDAHLWLLGAMEGEGGTANIQEITHSDMLDMGDYGSVQHVMQLLDELVRGGMVTKSGSGAQTTYQITPGGRRSFRQWYQSQFPGQG